MLLLLAVALVVRVAWAVSILPRKPTFDRFLLSSKVQF
jgi:hypothetical protein